MLTPHEVSALILAVELEMKDMHDLVRGAKGSMLREASAQAFALAQAVHLASHIGRAVGEVIGDLRALVNALDTVLLFGSKARLTVRALESASSGKLMAKHLMLLLDQQLHSQPTKQPPQLG